MSYKNYTWEVAAHDYDSPYLRNWLWTHSFFKYPKLLSILRVVIGIASRNNEIDYLADFSTWTKAHKYLKTKVLENSQYFENLINQSLDCGSRLNSWTQEYIFERNLSELAGTELVTLLHKFIDKQEDENAYGTALSILDFSGYSFIEGNLNRILKEKVSPKKFKEYYSVFTEPENNSFAQDQEVDLLKLMNIYWTDDNWRADIAQKSLDEIKVAYPRFYSDLSKHTQRHAWVYYVYMGPAFTEKDFYGFIIDHINKGIVPKTKLNELGEKRKTIRATKEKYLRELQLTDFEAFVLKIASKVVWAKPRRKDYQSKSFYHAEQLCLEIAKRLSISLQQARSLPTNVLEKALLGEEVDLSIASEIAKLHVCLPNDDSSVATLTGKEAEEFLRYKVKRIEDKPNSSNNKVLTGSTACIGNAIGHAKIINVPEDMKKMEKGDILVSAATTPSIVSAMKKAAAILTDEGGLTCHASIVSRELNIPCIVGLKTITKFVKDGDKVEVDATSAIVRKID